MSSLLRQEADIIRPSRLPIDCLHCKNRGVLALDDDRMLPCMLCLADVPTFVPITPPYRGSLIAGMRPAATGETLFEGYACDYHKATLRSYSYIAPPTSYATAMARHETGRSLRARLGRLLAPIDTGLMVLASTPVQQGLLRKSYADDARFTITVRVDKAIRVEWSRAFCSNGSLRWMAGGARARGRRVVSPGGERRPRR